MTSALNTELLDPAVVQQLLDLGGDEFLAELAQLFLDDLQPRLDELDAAIDARDNVAAANVAHALKGSSLNLGVRSLAELAARVENGQRVNADQDPRPLLVELHRAASVARECLQQIVTR